MNILGANWKTTVSGIGAAFASLLAALSTISLTTEGQALLAFMSEPQKRNVAIGSAIAAVALKFWNSIVQKDRNTTGGTVQQTANGEVASCDEQLQSTAVAETNAAIGPSMRP